MVTRQQRRKSAKRIWRIGSVVVAMLAMVVCGIYYFSNLSAVPASTPLSQEDSQTRRFLPRWQDILSAGIPGFNVGKEPAVVSVRPAVDISSVLRGTISFFTAIDVQDIRSIFIEEIPFMAQFANDLPAISAMNLPNFPKFDWKNSTFPGQPLVGVYHTHTSESFIPSSGVDHAPGGQRGDIVDVGEALVNRLAKDGIPAVQSKNINDYPSFMKAYDKSEVTASEMLADYPSLQMIFDIHRDADIRDNTTVMINGVPVARITIVVAMGQPDLVQPHWQENHAFAKLIDARLNEYYPGLSHGIELTEWRYNQHLHPRALLIEVGGQENSKEECMRSMEILADILAKILRES